MLRTHCKQGHEYTKQNIYIRPEGYRDCRICKSNSVLKWGKNNPKQNRLRKRKYYLENKEKQDKSVREWLKSNPGRKRQYNSKRRALKKNAVGIWDYIIPRQLFIYQDGKCFYCGMPLVENGKFYYQEEHMLPLSRGGKHDYRNICLSCKPCNLRKGMKTSEEFIKETQESL